MLEKATTQYRRGYFDGLDNRPIVMPLNPSPFAQFDYVEGYKAGQNERKWTTNGERQ